MTTHPFSVKQALAFGLAEWRKHFLLFAGVTLFVLLVPVVPVVVARLSGIPDTGTQISTQLVHIAHALFRIALHLGFINFALKVADGQQPKFADLLSIGQFFPFLISSLLFGLMATIGLFLLIVPAVIVGVRFYLFGYVMVDKKLGPIASLKESLSITSGHFWQLSLFSVLLLLINVAGLLLLGIGLLVSVPISAIATAYVYRQLEGETKTAPATTF